MAVPILWRNRKQRYSLEGEVCSACERAVFPPRPVCPYCSREIAAAVPVAASVDLGLIMDLPELESEQGCQDVAHVEEQRAGYADTYADAYAADAYAERSKRTRADYAFIWPRKLAPEVAARQAGDD